MGKREPLAEVGWRRPSGARDFFQKQWVEARHLTGVRVAQFREFVGLVPADLRSGFEDHSKIWYAGKKKLVFTTEPYGLSTAGLRALLGCAAQHSMHVEIDARSPHNPGATLLVIMWRRECMVCGDTGVFGGRACVACGGHTTKVET